MNLIKHFDGSTWKLPLHEGVNVSSSPKSPLMSTISVYSMVGLGSFEKVQIVGRTKNRHFLMRALIMQYAIHYRYNSYAAALIA